MSVRFDPTDRHFVFSELHTEKVIKRLPAKNLEATDLLGLITLPVEPYQLSLPLFELGVNVQ